MSTAPTIEYLGAFEPTPSRRPSQADSAVFAVTESRVFDLASDNGDVAADVAAAAAAAAADDDGGTVLPHLGRTGALNSTGGIRTRLGKAPKPDAAVHPVPVHVGVVVMWLPGVYGLLKPHGVPHAGDAVRRVLEVSIVWLRSQP